MSQTFYIFRHGLATRSLFGYGDKILTADILAEGRPPITRMADFLKTVPSDFNICSEIKRCQQTAGIVTKKTGKQFTLDKRLNEYYNESFGELRDRVKDFVKDIQTTKYSNILICTHGAVIAALKNFIVKNNFSLLAQFDYPKTGVLVIINGKKIEEKDFNQPSKL